MEGYRRALAAWLAVTLVACALVAVASGCGGDSDAQDTGAIATKDPERTFAPVIEVAADEPWRPMSARWFLEHSIFGFAEDEGCEDRVIAVGRTLTEIQTQVTDWIFPKGLGKGPTYYRNPQDDSCEIDGDYRFDADQLTRPHDPGPRIAGIRPGEGFYLDLVDGARGGPSTAEGAVPAYVERSDEGDSQVRLTYWMLFGMHGVPGEGVAHEGDWERVDVLLRDAGDNRYVPLSVQTMSVDGTTDDGASGSDARDDQAWDAVRRVDRTHPVITARRATHEMIVAARGGGCANCVRIDTWRSLSDARDQLWYGFGGAWGEVGPTSAATGPLGPHGFWPDAQDKRDELAEYAESL